MSAITKTVNSPSLASTLPPSTTRHSALIAGANLNSYDACYIDQSTGYVFQSLDTGATANQAQVDGYAPRSYLALQPCTLVFGVEVLYCDASGMTPGSDLFLSSSVAGGLDTAATNSHAPCGRAITSQLAWLGKRWF